MIPVWKIWAERWIAAYLALSALPMIFGPGAQAATMKLALQQLVLAAAVVMFSRFVQRKPGLGWLSWAFWFPLLPWVYGQMDVVQRSLKRPLYDSMVQGWEQKLFPFSPALEWSQRWPWWWFSELMHFFYFTYYLVLPILILRLLRRGLETRARLSLAGGIATLVVCYAIIDFFPVQGPRPVLPGLASNLHGPFWMLTHFITDKAACAAAAFPSGHVALTMAVFVMGLRWDSRLAWFYGLCVLGIWAGTVYGRFHYVVDGLAGILIGAICAGVAVQALDNMAEEDMPL